MTIQVMIDIETMGVGAAAAILSIGAVRFDPYAVPGKFAEEEGRDNSFYCKIDLASCMRAGMQVDASTLYFWLRQSEEARKGVLPPDDPEAPALMPIDAALAEFHGWYGTDNTVPVWANGTDFDCTILKTAYLINGWSAPPWKYNAPRDYRTMRLELEPLFPFVTYEEPDVKHNAFHDALAQARHLQKLYGALRTARVLIDPTNPQEQV